MEPHGTTYANEKTYCTGFPLIIFGLTRKSRITNNAVLYKLYTQKKHVGGGLIFTREFVEL
jgi:hypothetical protein